MSSSSSQSWVCYIVSFLPLFDLGEERRLQTPVDQVPGALTISWVVFLFINNYSYYAFLPASLLSNCVFLRLSTSLYQVSSCHWLRTPDRNHLKKKGSFIRTDNFIGFSPWSGGTSWRRLRLNKVAHFLLAGYQKASKQLEKRCLSKACLQWTAFFSQSQFLIRPLGCSIIKDPLMRSEFLWFSHIPRAPKLATKTSANWIWETFQI